MMTVPVVAGDTEMRFVFDTGIGVNLVSESVATLAGSLPGGAYTGRRMSGQELTVPVGLLNSLSVGDCLRTDVPAGILDLAKLAGLDGIGGFLSLDYFRSTPVTVDYSRGNLVIEDAESLTRRVEAGMPVDVHVEHDAFSTSVFLGLDLPGGRSVSVEVDSGSNSLILDVALAAGLGVDLRDASTRKADGRDETGRAFTRYFADLHGDVRVAGAPMISQADPEVMFQQIIYDGLVGHAFLRSFVVTYDLANARMIFAIPG